VQAALATLFPFEMFNNIRNVNLFAVDTGPFQCAVQQLACGSDEWLSLKIFVVPGLLSDEEKTGLPGTLTKYGLGRMLPQITCFTVLCSGLKSTKRARVGFGGFHFPHAGLRLRDAFFSISCWRAVIRPPATNGLSCRVALGGSIRTFFAYSSAIFDFRGGIFFDGMIGSFRFLLENRNRHAESLGTRIALPPP